jgi:hypothetical protein
MLANRQHAGLPEANKAPRIIGQEKTEFLDRLGCAYLAFQLQKREKKLGVGFRTLSWGCGGTGC